MSVMFNPVHPDEFILATYIEPFGLSRLGVNR